MTVEATILAMFLAADAKARALYPAYAAHPVPKVSFFTKGQVSGWARRGTWEVKFNVHIAAQALKDFHNTVSHEIAHMVDYTLRGRSGHDKFWKEIHRALGGNGSRCSQYKASTIRSRVKNEYLYRNASGAELWCGPKHHAAMQRGKISGVHSKNTNQRFYYADWTGKRRTIT